MEVKVFPLFQLILIVGVANFPGKRKLPPSLVEQRDPVADPVQCDLRAAFVRQTIPGIFIHFGAAKLLCSLPAIIVFA